VIVNGRSARVLFAGGGTGGHLFPGIAVARELRRRDPEWQVVFVGAGRALEVRVLSREGFALERVRAVGLVGHSPLAVTMGLAQLPMAFLDAWRLLKGFQPDIVVGLGGYSSGPVVLLAALGRIATLLMEQNAVPGVTNRLLGRVVQSAAVSYDETRSCFGTKGFVSGNPVRAGFFKVEPPRSTVTEPRILVIGGSQGAHALNVAMVEAAPVFAQAPRSVRITHQSGETDLEMVREGYRSAGVTARVEAFFESMDTEMSDADVVVCRAGATTLAELAATGRPAILVPYPHAANDHQRLNAALFQKHGAVDVIDPDELTATLLGQRLLALAVDDDRRLARADATRRLGMPDAAGTVADRIERLIAGKES
jgi:UDP-N-acetylglucosamine--N-acetylmuramyl-(pentapeptide) pyrophosphoryl-undecaprenol N-acetylglucosamine transferase